MAILMTVQAGSLTRTVKLDLDELGALEIDTQRSEELTKAFAVVFDATDENNASSIRCGEFLAVVETLLRQCKSGLQTPVYSVFGSPIPGRVPRGSSLGTGMMIDGKRCLIMGGVNQCTLTTYTPGDNGIYKPISEEDIRHLKLIKTDDQGDVEIRKRIKPARTLVWLRQLKKALAAMSSESNAIITIG